MTTKCCGRASISPKAIKKLMLGMKKEMYKALMVIVAGVVVAINGYSQVRPVESDAASSRKPAAPSSFAAKYEGGMFGFNEREVGTLKFDEENKRLVFFGKDQKEKFSFAYDAMQVIYPQSKSVTSTTGNVVRNIPLPGAILGGFIKEKRQYLVLHFDDPDFEIKGVVNFKLDNRELLDSVIQTLGEKAKLKQRGDAYYRPRSSRTEI